MYSSKERAVKLGEVSRYVIDIVGVCREIKKIEQKCDESILDSY